MEFTKKKVNLYSIKLQRKQSQRETLSLPLTISRRKNMKNIELMSPVGSYETLMAAIQGGANSIYFGIGKLNMRSKSTHNFTVDDIEKIVEICHKNNIRAYLALNTIIYDKDIEQMKQLVDTAKKHKITAIIASDLAVITYTRKQNIEVHASTQLNICNIEAVRFFAQFTDVMVLARELNLTQVKYITDTIKNENITGPNGKLVEIEIFIHGALCMAVSGKCYLSLHEQNSSANRGACLQTCRKAYTVTEKESGYQLEVDNEYIMSPKDLCTIGFIDEILDAGVTVLKIEGRARPAEYVKTVTNSYRKAIEAYNNKTLTKELAKSWHSDLKTVFNRGFWDGYFLGQKFGEWNDSYGSKAEKKKFYIAKCTNFFSKIGIGEFLLQAGDLKIGDEILIIGPTTGVVETTITEIRKDLGKIEHAKKGDLVSIAMPEKIRRADKLYKLLSK